MIASLPQFQRPIDFFTTFLKESPELIKKDSQVIYIMEYIVFSSNELVVFRFFFLIY